MIILSNHMRTFLRTFMRRMTMKLLQGARDEGMQSPLVMISLCTLWMILPRPLLRYASLDADDWKEAVQNEMDSILSNGTWE
jgi:hypothetical protein